MNARWALGRPERGMSLVGMILTATVVAVAVVSAMKLVPAVIEYYIIQKDANAVVASPEMKDASVNDVRTSFLKRAQVDDITAVTPADLEITKEGGSVVIGFSYSKKIPLFGPASLVLDFEGRTKPAK